MIHQELSAVPEMLVAENIYLGREPLNRFRLVDKKRMVADARAVFAKWQIDIDPRRVMKTPQRGPDADGRDREGDLLPTPA